MSLKIGILTFHREENFGAVLQAYGTLNFLKQNGHDVSVIDYDPTYRRRNRNLISPYQIKATCGLMNKFRFVLSRIKGVGLFLKTKKVYADFFKNEFGLSDKSQIKNITDSEQVYDVVVIGSDQLWQPFAANGYRFDSAYFGIGVNANRKVAYGASMGNLNMTNDDNLIEFKRLITLPDVIYSRERDLDEMINSFGVKSEHVCDPVFLLGKSRWIELAKRSKLKLPQEYVFVHRTQDDVLTNEIVDALYKNLNIPVITQNRLKNDVPQIVNNSPKIEDILYLLLNASFVVTSSFHCVAFSLIFNKKFLTFNKNPERARSICEKMGVEERVVSSFSKKTVDDIVSSGLDIDYETHPFVMRSRYLLSESIR